MTTRQSKRHALRIVGIAFLWLAALSTTALAQEAGGNASAHSGAKSFLGLTASIGAPGRLWEGPTDYAFSLRPSGKIRAVMLFAKFTDATKDEKTEDLYARLAPEGTAFFERVSYGKMTLQIDPVHRWIAMDHPSTWPNYNCSRFDSQKNYLAEVIGKAAGSVDFKQYDIVYVVGAQGPGVPNSPTFGAPVGEGIQVNGTEIRHAVTFGNDMRLDRWGWQTLAHETGHIFGLPDLYSFDDSRPYKSIHKYVGFWDLMGFQAVGCEYLAWQKRKLEWLSDRDFFVIAGGKAEVSLASIYAKSGRRAAVVPISATEAYVVEVRSRDGKPESELGVLLYKVSLKGETGHGPIRILPASPDTSGPLLERKFITLYNALYREGLALNDETAHVRIEILGHTDKSFRLRITR